MHDHQPKPSVFAILDTAVASCGLLWMLAHDVVIGLFAIGVCAMYTWGVIAQYRVQGLYVGIRELVFFYIEIPCWKIVTGRVPHDRIHPKHKDSENCPCCSHEAQPVRSFGDFLAFQLIGLPMLAFVLPLKASAVIFGPLIYIGFAFRASDYAGLELQARSAYRSSFKQIWIVVAMLGIGLFAAKVVLYSQWSNLQEWWDSHKVLAFLSPFVHPPAFLPFHLTSVCSAILLLLATALVDRAMHKIDDAGLTPDSMPTLLKSIRIVGRVRLVLSLYTWSCLIWISIPWLRELRFPPVSFEFLPQ